MGLPFIQVRAQKPTNNLGSNNRWHFRLMAFLHFSSSLFRFRDLERAFLDQN